MDHPKHASLTRRKIIHIITRLDGGGSARNTFLTVIGHDPARFCVGLVYGRPQSSGAEDAARLAEDREALNRAGVLLFEVPSLVRDISPWKDLRATLAIWRLLRRERPDLVHTHTSKAGAIGRLAAWFAGVPAIIHTPHGHIFYGYYGPAMSAVVRWAERMLAKITDRIITLTDRGIDEHVLLKIAARDRFMTIPSGLMLSEIRGHSLSTVDKRHALGIPADGLIVGTVGRLVPVKGHTYLIRAIPHVAAGIPNVTFVFVGDGPLRRDLQGLVEELGVGRRVVFLGARRDVPECLSAFDLFCFPSLNEGMGRALIEAMAVGLPVVASRVGGIPDVVADGKTGVLVPPGDERALATAITDLLRDPRRLAELGSNAGQSVTDRFDAKTMVRDIEHLYETVWREKLLTA